MAESRHQTEYNRDMESPRIIGLTGGIASGKSTVAQILTTLGAAVVDADDVARSVVEPGSPGLQRLKQQFGDAIISDSGTLDRSAVAQIVFSNPQARKQLNAILHPLIAAESQRRIAALAKQGHRLVIYDAALLVENDLHKNMDALIVVSVPESLQRERLAARDGLDDSAIASRLRAQLPLEKKTQVADYIVDNSGTIEETRRQTTEMWKTIIRDFSPTTHL